MGREFVFVGGCGISPAFRPPRRYSWTAPGVSSRPCSAYARIGRRRGLDGGVFLVAMRALQGLGGAMVFATAVAILVSVTPQEQRGRLLGINVASVYLGLTAGPFLGGVLTQQFGWRSIFIAVAFLGLATFVVTIRVLEQERKDLRAETLDLMSAVTYIVALSTLMLGFSFLPSAAGIVE